MAEAQGDLRCVQPHALDGEAPFALEAVEELAAGEVVEHHVQLALVLECCRDEGEPEPKGGAATDLRKKEWSARERRWRAVERAHARSA